MRTAITFLALHTTQYIFIINGGYGWPDAILLILVAAFSSFVAVAEDIKSIQK